MGLLLPLIYFSSAAKSQKYCCRYSRQNALLKTILKFHITTGMELPILVLLCIILMYPYACGRWARWTSDEFDCQKGYVALSWWIGGKRRGMSSACGCGLENGPLLITASVPCDSFRLDQFNNLTDTNFHYCQHGAANTRAKDQAVCPLRFPYRQRGRRLGCVSGLRGAGMRMGCRWGKVTGWSFGAPGGGCRLNNVKYLVLICKPSKLRMRPVRGIAQRARNAVAVRGFDTQMLLPFLYKHLFQIDQVDFFSFLTTPP